MLDCSNEIICNNEKMKYISTPNCDDATQGEYESFFWKFK